MRFSNIIYFDNAATTRKKPDTVYESFNRFVKEIGTSPGRGSHFLAIEASRALYQSRKAVSDYFGCVDIQNTIFTKNATEASNLFLNSFLKRGDHVVISSFEHNAILRPLHKLKENGIIDYDVINIGNNERLNSGMIDKFFRCNTKLFITTLSSNVTGERIFQKEIIEYLHSRNVMLLIDTAQGAGRTNINMYDDNIDFLIFTGHKDLYGLPGSGGLCSLHKLKLAPLIQGGTGVQAETFTNPDIYPESLEAGTLNMPSIWSLKSGIEFIQNNRREIVDKEKLLYKRLVEGLKSIKNVISYGENQLVNNTSIISFNIKDMDCQEVSFRMSEKGICVRSGIHCNILAHKSLGTEHIGTVRASIDYFNSFEEVDRFLEITEKITMR